MASRGVKLTSFYGQQVPRPYVLLDDKGDVTKGRVDPPVINDALIEWAQKVPVKQGGVLVKPVWDGSKDELPKEARNDFQIFFEEQWDDILAANPALFAHGLADRKALLSAASIYWRERLTNEERAQYRQRAAEEKRAAKAALAEAEQSNPKFKAFRNKMQKYKEAMHSIVSAARASTGPLWRAQRLMNAKYRQLEAEAEEHEEEHQAEEQAEKASGSKAKAAAKGKAAGKSKSGKAGAKGGRGKAAATKKRLVDSDSESSDGEDWDEDAAAAADAAAEAAEAMQKLLLATAKKQDAKARGKKAAGGSAKKKGASRKAAAAKAAKEPEEEQEEVVSSEEEAEQQPQGGRSRSGTARLAAEKAAAASKGRRGYVGAYELPPSQNPTPAKPGKGGKAAAEAAAAAAAMQALKSPGKRTRGGSSGQAVVAEVHESPAKKQRRAPARRG